MHENDSSLKNLLGFIGLCRRAGHVICGTPLICLALGKRPKPQLVLYAEGASAATRKKLESKCSFYDVRIQMLAISPAVLTNTVGKGGNLAAIAITDSGFAEAILKKMADISSSS